jgi:hypothetical protein
MNVRVLCLSHLFRRVDISIEQSTSLDTVAKLKQGPVKFEHSTDSRYCKYEGEGNLQSAQIEFGFLKPGFGDSLRGFALLNDIKSINFDGLFCMHKYFFRVSLLILHAVLEVHSFIPFWERAFEASGTFGGLFKF